MTDIDCAICLCSLNSDNIGNNTIYNKKKKNNKNKIDNIIVKLLCGHRFHLECIKQLKDYKCPLCRQGIELTNLCQGKHINTGFYIPFYKMDGSCRFCKKKSLKGALEQLVENELNSV